MKKILFVFIFCNIYNSYCQNCNVSGVVTYFFNKYQGDKPDIGAKVYVIDSISNIDFDYKAISHLNFGKSFITLYNNYYRMNLQNEELLKLYGNKKKYAEQIKEANDNKEYYKKKMDEFYTEMIKYNVETDEKLKELHKKTYETCSNAINKENTISKTVNGTGDYSITINSGTYYVLIISKNRTGTGLSDYSGLMFCQKIKIENGQTKDVSNNFNL